MRQPQLSFFFFAKKFCRVAPVEDRPRTLSGPLPLRARMRWSGQIFWLLASEAVEGFWLRVERREELFCSPQPLNCSTSQLASPPSRLHPRPSRRLACSPECFRGREVVSSYSSATAPDSHGISRADPLIKLAKNCGDDKPVALACSRYFAARWPLRP